MKDLIQIAGVKDMEEARLLMEAGVHRIGFPLKLAKHREDIPEEEAAEIIRALGLSNAAILITYLDHPEEIVRLCRRLGVRRVQIHGDMAPAEVGRLKAMAPDIHVMKSLVVREGNLHELEYALKAYSFFADAFITDTFDPETGASGATGKTHDWEVSRRLVEISPRPVILAGGLNPWNVRKAIRHVHPAGVDAHTGVEGPDGAKDRLLVGFFVQEAQKAFSEISSNYPANR